MRKVNELPSSSNALGAASSSLVSARKTRAKRQREIAAKILYVPSVEADERLLNAYNILLTVFRDVDNAN
jgi:hypothetical protein